jgi:hypothetical protein
MPSRFQVQLSLQRRACYVLMELTELASREKLPLLNWTIGTSGVQITGFSYTLPSITRRQELTAWAAALGIKLTEHPGAGAVTITGSTRRFRTSFDGAVIMLACDVYHEDARAAEQDRAERHYVVPGHADGTGPAITGGQR